MNRSRQGFLRFSLFIDPPHFSNGDNEMTRLDFMVLLGEFLIDFDVAVENDGLVKLLREKASKQTIREYLISNF